MSNPGNKRLQRAMHGSSPSAKEGERVTTTYRSNGRTYTVSRQTGSVINNGGNTEAGLYPRVGMSLGFLRRTRATPESGCGACVANEDAASVTPLARAQAQVAALSTTAAANAANTAANNLSVARLATAAAVGTLNSATTSAATTSAQTALDAARVTEATELADYNQALANKAASDAADAYITRVAATASARTTLASASGATAIAAAQNALNTAVAAEATALDAWLAAEL